MSRGPKFRFRRSQCRPGRVETSSLDARILMHRPVCVVGRACASCWRCFRNDYIYLLLQHACSSVFSDFLPPTAQSPAWPVTYWCCFWTIRRLLKTFLFFQSTSVHSASEAHIDDALYKLMFYLLTYLLTYSYHALCCFISLCIYRMHSKMCTGFDEVFFHPSYKLEI